MSAGTANGVCTTIAPWFSSRTESRTTSVLAASPRPSDASACSDGEATATWCRGLRCACTQSAASREMSQRPAPFEAATCGALVVQSTSRTLAVGPTIRAVAARASSLTLARPTASTRARPACRSASSRAVARSSCRTSPAIRSTTSRNRIAEAPITTSRSVLPELLDEVDPRRDQAREREQREARRRESDSGVGRRLLEAPHRRVECRRAPEHRGTQASRGRR